MPPYDSTVTIGVQKMTKKECGIKIIWGNRPPTYDRRLCEKPISYHRKKSKERTKGKTHEQIKEEYIQLCHDLGFEPTL